MKYSWKGLLLMCALACQGESTERVRLGTVHVPSSGTLEARDHFERGVLYLHSFEYDHAAAAFRQAQEADSTHVLAYWGEAMTYTHPVWNQQDREAAREVLGRLAPTTTERLEKAPTDRERAYLAAVEILYGDGSKTRRDTLYSAAMYRLMLDYPDDVEAKAFYALSLLGLSQGDRDVPTYMRAARYALEVVAANAKHPGGAHYVIHSFDDPVHAPLGLEAARAYSAIAPDAAHAQHMTSHIFVAMGMWDDLVAANERATAVMERDAGRSPVGCGHYNEWLQYGYLQQGRHEDAARLLRECAADVDADRRGPGSLADMRAMYLVDTEEWQGDAHALPLDTAKISQSMRFAVDLADGMSALDGGRRAEARNALRRMESRRRGMRGAGAGNGQVMERVLRAAISYEAGRVDDALEELDRAAQLEESLPFAFGPPAVYKPPRELKAEILLQSNRVAEARVEFENALARTPQRTRTLLGLAKAAELTDGRDVATAAVRQIEQNLKNADAPIRTKVGLPVAEGATDLND